MCAGIVPQIQSWQASNILNKATFGLTDSV